MQYHSSDSFGSAQTLRSESSHFIPNHFKGLAKKLSKIIGRKDRCTSRHVRTTARYAVRIALELRGAPGAPVIDRACLERIWWAAALHDLGKVGVEDEILRKAGALAPEERRSMRQHPRLGLELMGSLAQVREVAEGTLYHHERWDGMGYPFGLAGTQIPWVARLIAVADAYDAMTSTRPYRDGLSAEVAYAEILELAGTQFDPTIVRAFARALTPGRRSSKSLNLDLMT